MLHLREVASLLYDAGAPDHLIAAGVLHDVIEKTGVAASELRKRFGTRIATLVLAVREDEHLAGATRRPRPPCAIKSPKQAMRPSRSSPRTRSQRRGSCALGAPEFIDPAAAG